MRIDEITALPSLQAEAKLIHRDCQPFLSQIGGKVGKLALFRGLGSRAYAISTGFDKVETQIDREPMSTEPIVHKISDDWFFNRFGIRYRSNSVFATGYPGHASGYGVLYAIFPIGDFQICYSPVINDLYDQWTKYEDEHEYPLDGLTFELISDEVDIILSRGRYKSGPLATAIRSKNEVMVHCGEYYQLKVAGNYVSILAQLQKEIENL